MPMTTLRRLIAYAIRHPNYCVAPCSPLMPPDGEVRMLDWQAAAVAEVIRRVEALLPPRDALDFPIMLDWPQIKLGGDLPPGRTTRLIERAPDGAIFVVRNAGKLAHCRSILRTLGRQLSSVRFMIADDSLGSRLAGVTAPIVVDHDAEPDRRARDMIEIVRERHWRGMLNRALHGSDIEDDGFVTVLDTARPRSCICGVLAVPGCPIHSPAAAAVQFSWATPQRGGA